MVADYFAPIQVRGGTGGHVIRNNLTTQPIQLRDGAPANNTIDGNIYFATPADFATPGEPQLQAGSAAIGGGVATSVTSHIDGNDRAGRWDVGADHYTE